MFDAIAPELLDSGPRSTLSHGILVIAVCQASGRSPQSLLVREVAVGVAVIVFTRGVHVILPHLSAPTARAGAVLFFTPLPVPTGASYAMQPVHRPGYDPCPPFPLLPESSRASTPCVMYQHGWVGMAFETCISRTCFRGTAGSASSSNSAKILPRESFLAGHTDGGRKFDTAMSTPASETLRRALRGTYISSYQC